MKQSRLRGLEPLQFQGGVLSITVTLMPVSGTSLTGQRGYWLQKLKWFPSGKSLPGTTYSDVIEFASIQTRLGNKEEAFLSLQKACDLHVPYLIWVLPGDPAFDPIRSDPRYRKLLRCIGVSR